MTMQFSAGAACHHETGLPGLRWGRATALLALSAALAGCASGPPHDPLEPYNRGMTEFNDKVDAAVLKPVATVYQDFTPALVRTGVSNFFTNIGDAWSFVNNVLQLRPEGALNSAVRFTVNTFFGLGGLLDIAGEMGVDRYKQDFGLTLGRWGVPPGPYVVLPLLGPSTVRDTLAMPVDWKGNLLHTVDPTSSRYSFYGLRVVDTRANLLRASTVLDAAALDKYSFMRDVYLRVRTQDSAPPQTRGEEADDGASEGVLSDDY